MTLIVGIKCKDGIVIAADGAATLGSLGNSTAKQSVRKLVVKHNHIVIGVSGPVGLGQRFQHEIDQLYAKGAVKNKHSADVMVAVSGAMRTHIQSEFQSANVAKNLLGGVAVNSVLASTVLAMVVKDKPCLFQFDAQGAPEEATDDLPFIAIGSGQPLADPFLAFLRRVFHPKGIPTLNEGIFWAVWALDHAIKTNAGGVAAPMQLIVLEHKDGDWLARELDEKECQEHLQNVDSAEAHLRAYGFIDSKASVAPPPIPIPIAKN
jgi:20S proteasome alpha/beta subunit